MSILSWNCQGLGNNLTFKVLKKIIIRAKPQLVFHMETKQSIPRMEEMRKKLGYKNFTYNEPEADMD